MNATQDANPETEHRPLPAVSVVLISKDRHDELLRCVASLREMDYPTDRLELVVVEEGEEPDPIDGLCYVPIPREDRGWGHARNVGIRNASHDLIAFVDDDCLVTRDWLRELVAPLRDEVGGVTGGVLVKDCNAVGYCENVLGFPNGGLRRIHRAGGEVRQTESLSTCNCLYKREVFETVGNFYDAAKTRGTDTEFANRVRAHRYQCLFAPQAVVYHKPRGGLWKIFKWFVERGKSEIFLLGNILDRRAYALYTLRKSLLLRLAALAAILYLVGPAWWIVLVALAGLYYLVILSRYAFQFRYLRRYDTLLLTPLVRLTMDAGIELGQILGLLAALRKRLKRGAPSG